MTNREEQWRDNGWHREEEIRKEGREREEMGRGERDSTGVQGVPSTQTRGAAPGGCVRFWMTG